MKKKNLDYLLQEAGRLAQEEDFKDTGHEFSEEYTKKKQQLMMEAEKMDSQSKKFRRPLAAAAAVVLVAGISITAYAAVRMIQASITEDKGKDSVNISVDRLSEEYIPPIEITPTYLPEGYEEWEEGKYSPGGEWGMDGISILDAGYCREFEEPDISGYEEVQIGEARAFILHSEGYTYPWNVILAYEESGHVIQLFGCDELSKEEIQKVCEGLEYKEVPEQDPNHEYQAFSWSDQEEKEAEGEETKQSAQAAGIYQMNERIPGAGMSLWDLLDEGIVTEGEVKDKVTYTVTDIAIKDKVNVELLNTDTTSDFEQVKPFLAEDGTLVPFTRIVSEWKDGELKERELGTTPVKNVEVTVLVENAFDVDLADINMQPTWQEMREDTAGNMVLSDVIPGYETDSSFRGVSEYQIVYDHMPYYFDSSAFAQSNHFYNMAVKAGESREVHLWFAIPEDQIEHAYLKFDGGIVALQ